MKRYTLFIPSCFEHLGVQPFESEVGGEKVLITPKIEYYEPLQYTENDFGFISAKEGIPLPDLQPQDIHLYFLSFSDEPLVLH